MHSIDLLGDDVEVLGGVERHVDPCQCADGFRPLTCAVHHHLGLDRSAVGDHPRHSSAGLVDTDDAGTFEHLGATGAGPARQRCGDVHRVRRGVPGQPDRTQEILGGEDRVSLLGLVRRDELALEVVGLGGRRCAPQLDHPVLGAGNGHPAASLEAGGQSGLLLQFAVERCRVLDEPSPTFGRPQLSDQTGGVPGRS